MLTTVPIKSGSSKREMVGTKRKRANKTNTSAVSSILGVSIFDGQKGPAQKKARSFQEESSSRMKLDSPSLLAAPSFDKPLLQFPSSRGPLLSSKSGASNVRSVLHFRGYPDRSWW
ncbi:hypothetical protein O1611_g3158 [Lasiodiplodia mahajangana]|uniref:Uncharacterized protein n=1 Tax=Lasiodiplodia mahajangana TaxID=1108764 RepID=A0ACC2JSJ2_9PEZI|nr:hypothetical protein O1611_g3158 [Lasiodiplodia mahajangana]